MPHLVRSSTQFSLVYFWDQNASELKIILWPFPQDVCLLHQASNHFVRKFIRNMYLFIHIWSRIVDLTKKY